MGLSEHWAVIRLSEPAEIAVASEALAETGMEVLREADGWLWARTPATKRRASMSPSATAEAPEVACPGCGSWDSAEDGFRLLFARLGFASLDRVVFPQTPRPGETGLVVRVRDRSSALALWR